MKTNLDKIAGFYQSQLGQYVFGQFAPVLDKHILTYGHEDKTCVCSAGFFPYLDSISEKVKRVPLQTYHEQSIWPVEGDGHYVFCDRLHWPYRAEEVDDIVLIHDLEFAEDPETYLREAWRVLKGEGRLIIVFPNRSGSWARHDNTPFGKGYPYTLEQMERLLKKAHFAIDKAEGALFYPPRTPKTIFGSALRHGVDRFSKYALAQPGVFIIEASKHIYQPTKGLKEIAAERAKALIPKTSQVSSNTTPHQSK